MRAVIRRTLITAVNIAGFLAFAWPFVFGDRFGDGSRWIPYVWALTLPALLLVAAQVLLGAKRDIRQVTLIATLIALGAAVRPLGAGVAGLEPVWAVMLLSGRALGARSGFLVGSLTMLTSGVLTGGVGPWLPYQMMAGAWVGAAAALFPRLRGRREVVWLMLLGGATGLLAGALLNLWFWPLAVGLTPGISFTPSAGVLENVGHWLRYGMLTSFGFDVPRAVLTAALLGLGGPSLLPILRRATRRATITAVLAETA